VRLVDGAGDVLFRCVSVNTWASAERPSRQEKVSKSAPWVHGLQGNRCDEQSQHRLMAVIALEIGNLSVTTKGYHRTGKCGFAAVYRSKSPPVLSGGLNGGENGGEIREQM
jgi:hypothetical protein